MKRKTAAILLLAALAGAAVAGLAVNRHPCAPSAAEDEYWDLGAAQYYGEFQGSAWRGALYPSYIGAVGRLAGGVEPSRIRRSQAALWALTAAAVFGLGTWAWGAPAGLFAAAGLLADRCWLASAGSLNVYFFYGVGILALAACAERWHKKPDPRASLGLGAATGILLSCRSALLALLPLHAALLWASPKTRGRRGTLLAAFLLGTAFALAPWTARNWLLFHRVIPLEDGTWNCVLLSASLGGPILPLEDVPRLAAERQPDFPSLSKSAQDRAVARMALENIFHRPGRYLAGFLRRNLELWGGMGILLLLAALNLRRPSAEFLPWAWLLLAFEAQALLSIQPSYGDSARPLLWALAGRGLWTLLPKARAKGAPSPWPARLAALPAAVLLAAFAASVAADARDAWSLGDPAPLNILALKPDKPSLALLDAAVRRAPHNFRYRNARATLRFLSGDAAGAREDYQEALRLNPRLAEARLGLGALRDREGNSEAALQEYEYGLASLGPGREPWLRSALIEARRQTLNSSVSFAKATSRVRR